MMAAPFFMMSKRMESLTRTIDRVTCILSKHYAPLIPLCNGEQIESWLALFRYEMLVMKLKFSESSLPFGSLLLADLILGGVTFAYALIRNMAAVSSFGSYFLMVSTFFLTNFALAAWISFRQDEIALKVREQQVTYILNSDASGSGADADSAVGVSGSEKRIPQDPNLPQQLDTMIGYLETNRASLKLLKLIPANFTFFTLIGGYAGTALVSLTTFIAATASSK
jgi:hypothetical protein